MSKYVYNQEAVENLRLSDTSILDRLIDFESARAAHLKKDHAKKDKRMSLTEAISTFIRWRYHNGCRIFLCPDASSGVP